MCCMMQGWMFLPLDVIAAQQVARKWTAVQAVEQAGAVVASARPATAPEEHVQLTAVVPAVIVQELVAASPLKFLDMSSLSCTRVVRMAELHGSDQNGQRHLKR